jgi:hypothetical protein
MCILTLDADYITEQIIRVDDGRAVQKYLMSKKK